MSEVACWKCGSPFLLSGRHVPFRAVCETCGMWLHCCKGCRYHNVTKANQCEIPGTDPIRDREGCNHCDSFEAIKERSLGEEGPSGKNLFDDLFND